MKIIVSATADSDEALRTWARDVRGMLRDSRDVQVSEPPLPPDETPAGYESRAILTALTTIAVTVLTSKAVELVIEAIRARDKGGRTSDFSYEVDLGDETGQLRCQAKGLTSDQLELMLRKWGEMLDRFAELKVAPTGDI